MLGKPGVGWLFFKVTLFTFVVPGTVTVLIPLLLLSRVSSDAAGLSGPSWLGLPVLLLGAALYFRCAYDFAGAGRGTPAPIDPPVALVARGPYRISRNPMYVGVLMVVLGEAIALRAMPLFYYLLLMALAFHLVVILYEEPSLSRQFGDVYEEYRATVPRWVPSLRRS